MLRRPEGTLANMTVERHEARRRSVVVRYGKWNWPQGRYFDHRWLPGDIGYIRIARCVSDFYSLIHSFDRALEELWDTRGLIIDVRSNPGGYGFVTDANADLVKRSYELGVRHFDTAAYYQRGLNEAMVGKAIEEMGVRDDVIIGTKAYVPHEQRPKMSPAELKKVILDTVEESLRRLRSDVLDIFSLHNVRGLGYMDNPGIMEALRILKETAPNGVDIPAMMRAHLYAVCYANYDQARETIRGIANGRGLSACATCADCSVRCRRRVPLERRLHELRMIYG